jgi:Uncharacterised nucleotidyltransferase
MPDSTGRVATLSRRRAHDFLCRLLSLDDSPGELEELRRAARSSAFLWHDVVALAGEEWVSPALSHALRRKIEPGDLPQDITNYFDGMATLNRQRNGKIRTEAIELTRILNGVGAVPIFLKGGANLLSGLYPDLAMRMMLDLDVLLPTEGLSVYVEVLEANGYVRLGEDGIQGNSASALHHYPPLARPGAVASVELHVDPLDIQYRRFLNYTEVSEDAVELTIEGVQLAVPSIPHRLVHCIAHTQFTDHAFIYGHLPLRELLDTAYLCRSGGIEWRAISGRFSSSCERTAAALHRYATERLLDGEPSEHASPTSTVLALFYRARFQGAHPALQHWIQRLLRPWLLFRRSVSHPLLRRRLLHCLLDPAWYARQWRMLREGSK